MFIAFYWTKSIDIFGYKFSAFSAVWVQTAYKAREMKAGLGITAIFYVRKLSRAGADRVYNQVQIISSEGRKWRKYRLGEGGGKGERLKSIQYFRYSKIPSLDSRKYWKVPFQGAFEHHLVGEIERETWTCWESGWFPSLCPCSSYRLLSPCSAASLLLGWESAREGRAANWGLCGIQYSRDGRIFFCE